MKKIISFFSFLLILFLISACNWQIPSKIQLKGSPSLKFALDMDFSEMFREMMGDAFYTGDNNIVIQDCTHNAIQDMTFLIRVGLVDEALDAGSILDNPTVPLPTDKKIFSNRVELPLSSLGNFLEGFKFNTAGINSSLFIDGSAIVDKIKLNLKFTDSQGQIHQVINNEKITPGASGVNPASKVYDIKNVIPPGGRPIDALARQFVGAKEDLTIDLDVILEAGPYSASLLNNSRVAVELVFWLPLIFESDGTPELKMPGFDGMGDFLKSLSDAGMIKYLKLQIGLNSNPFQNGNFVVLNTEDNNAEVFKIQMTGTSMGFELGEERLNYINNNPFSPDFKILFKEGALLRIPRTLKLMSVSLDAKIDHTIEIGG
jgi:hypothetical protein